MNSIKKCFASVLAIILVFSFFPFPQAQASEISTSTPTTIEEDLGNGITAVSTIEILPDLARNSTKRAISTSNFYNNGVWIGTVSLQATFSYNSITAGVVRTDYSTNLASGWSYKNHKITTTTVSSSNGGTATLTATLKKFPLNVAVRLSLHCSPDGTITRG